jgi:hypothetical protein
MGLHLYMYMGPVYPRRPFDDGGHLTMAVPEACLKMKHYSFRPNGVISYL